MRRPHGISAPTHAIAAATACGSMGGAPCCRERCGAPLTLCGMAHGSAEILRSTNKAAKCQAENLSRDMLHVQGTCLQVCKKTEERFPR
eukprot:3411247-Prymnesium_polylepis.1